MKAKKQVKKIFSKYEEGGKVSESKLSDYEKQLLSNVLINRNKDKDFIKRAFAVGQYPDSNMFQGNDDEEFGNKMSHKMAYGEDDKGQTYMFPTIYNDKREAVKVPNQLAEYISSEGYKKATGMKKKNGGKVEAKMAKGGKVISKKKKK